MTVPAATVIVCLLISTLPSFNADAAPKKLTAKEKSWLGVYSSPTEVAGYSGTVLSIEKGYEWQGGLRHRLLFYSDVSSANDIGQPEQSGDLLTDGSKVYVATARGYYEGRHKAVISGDLVRYTRLIVRGRTVLMRDDALYAYLHSRRLYDYGILIKVAEGSTESPRLEDAKHVSIKTLYVHRSKQWRDPFVHGANAR